MIEPLFVGTGYLEVVHDRDHWPYDPEAAVMVTETNDFPGN